MPEKKGSAPAIVELDGVYGERVHRPPALFFRPVEPYMVVTRLHLHALYKQISKKKQMK